jgi:hypothetical protein
MQMRPILTVGIALLGLLLIPTVALADGLTAVFGFQLLHLIVGNLLIGVIETIYLQARFSLKANMILIIAGNYVSMLCGFVVASYLTKLFGFENFNGDTSNVKDYHIALVLGIFISFLVTLIVELPFYKWAIKNSSWKFAFQKEIEPNILTNILVLIVYFFIRPGK